MTYVVEPDPKYGVPSDSDVPEEATYDYNAPVKVADNLTTKQGFAVVSGTDVPGTWTFTPWDKDDFNITEDTEIHGEWTFTPDTYKVTYVVEEDPTYGKPADSVTPVDNVDYDYLAPVDVEDNLTTKQDYATVSGTDIPGTWTFTPWDKDDFNITEDTEIHGKWEFTPDTYKVTYVVEADPKYGVPSDSDVPEEATYDYNAPVKVADDLTTKQGFAVVSGTDIPGTWTFTPWDKDDFNITEDTEIHGKWEFTPDTYKVTYVVEADPKYGVPSDSDVPEEATYDYNAPVKVADDLTTKQGFAVVSGTDIPGTWTFTSWDKEDFNITKDTEIKGKWEFTPDTYKVTYVVEADPIYGVPSDSDVPVDGTVYDYLAPVDVEDNLTTKQDYATVSGTDIPGTWTFTPWNKGDFTITEDTEIHGKWEFTPNTYNVTYVVEEDPVYGVPYIGEEPVDENNPYNYNEPVTIKDDLTTIQSYANDPNDPSIKIPGTWLFTSWDKDDFTITEDTEVHGKWKFVPEKYTVAYVVENDPTYGRPEDGGAPTDDNNPYSYNDLVTVKDNLTTIQGYAQDPTDPFKRITGTWTFEPWDKDDFNITENTEIHGRWVFTPDEEVKPNPSTPNNNSSIHGDSSQTGGKTSTGKTYQNSSSSGDTDYVYEDDGKGNYIPNTGDQAPVLLISVLFAVSAAVVVTIIIVTRAKKKKAACELTVTDSPVAD